MGTEINENIRKEISAGAIKQAEEWQFQVNKLSGKVNPLIVKLNSMVKHPVNKVFFINLMDKCFRARSVRVTERLMTKTIHHYTVKNLFSAFESTLIVLYKHAGRFLPAVAVPAVIQKVRKQTETVIISGEKSKLNAYLAKRKKKNLPVNLNIIGEAILGEGEADKKVQEYIDALRHPDINYISVKISTIFSQINVLAFEDTLQKLDNRLSELYRAAIENKWTDRDGMQKPKFINLDMEEYRDVELTFKLFTSALSKPEFKDLRAGIVLQAYLPDSFELLKKLTQWSKERVKNGGAPVKVRLVKGANMDMESTESSLRGWELAPYSVKAESDANYKRLMEFAFNPDNIPYLNVGIASHNIFDLAYAAVLIKKYDLLKHISFEMLEGMAGSTVKVLIDAGFPVLMYAPTATKDKFINAIAYFVRRLDENTAPDNFLTHSFRLVPNTPAWENLKDKFLESVELIDKVSSVPNRKQSRLKELTEPEGVRSSKSEFVNEDDTDWILPENRKWAEDIKNRWLNGIEKTVEEIPVVIDGKNYFDGRNVATVMDKSRYEENIIIAKYAKANSDDINKAVEIAKSDISNWTKLSHDERHEILLNVAAEIKKNRGELIGVAAAETAKTFTETDIEVTEATDFATYYPYSINAFYGRSNLDIKARGIGVVVPPWNFPIAIPAGGMLASLAAGNNTIIKPSSDAVYCAWKLCNIFWNAGVPKSALQFVPCSGAGEGSQLVSHSDVDFVILTGGTNTALNILKNRPDIDLYAETGGKNATIVTSSADREQAIKNVLHSAFSNNGQKCSATSLLLLEREIYEDERFKQVLKDAVESLEVGDSWDFKSRLSPMSTKISGDLEKSLTLLEEGEEWLVKPEIDENNPYRITPGVKYGVKPGNFTYVNELFGPVLSVMKYDTLEEAVGIVNGTGFGLTSGIESLDEDEIKYWRENIKAGNLYINRVTTGAIVLRQPFGGMGKSAFGPGIKAGGPNYVQMFADIEESSYPRKLEDNESVADRCIKAFNSVPALSSYYVSGKELEQIDVAIKSYTYEWNNYFSKEIDYFNLRGEQNVSRYLPVDNSLIHFSPDSSAAKFIMTLIAADICRVNTTVSINDEVGKELKESVIRFVKAFNPRIPVRTITEEELEEEVVNFERARFMRKEEVPLCVTKTAAPAGCYIASKPAKTDGRLELLNYLKEQSISYAYHRYGNISDWEYKEEK